jgi:adenylate cyclase
VKELAGKIPCRPIEKVAVRGRVKGTLIYTPRRSLSPREAQAWTIHEKAVTLFYDRDFRTAAEALREVLNLLPEDTVAARLLERSETLMKNPPPDDWTGVTMMSAAH